MELNQNLITQGFGVLAALSFIISYAIKSDTKTKFGHAIASFLWAVHFFMMGAGVGGVTNLISGFRGLLSVKYDSIYLASFFSILYIIFGIYFYKDPFSILAIIASIGATLGMFLLKGIPFRLSMSLVIILWLFYNIHNESIGGVITCIFFIIANSITIYRIYLDEKKAS